MNRIRPQVLRRVDQPAVNDHPFHAPGKFPKSSRLLKHADFQAVYHEGKKHFSANITAFYRRRNNGAGVRVGLTVGKVLGGAVARNRIRRRMRAAVRPHLAEFAAAVDIVLHPRKSVLTMEFSRLEAEVEKILAEVLKGRSR